MNLAAHSSQAGQEYRRSHFYAKGWTEAQPELAASERPPRPTSPTRQRVLT